MNIPKKEQIQAMFPRAPRQPMINCNNKDWNVYLLTISCTFTVHSVHFTYGTKIGVAAEICPSKFQFLCFAKHDDVISVHVVCYKSYSLSYFASTVF